MTHMTIQVPVRALRGPRGAEPFANAAFSLLRMVRLAGLAMLRGLRSRHLLAHAPAHAPNREIACKDGIGLIKG